MLSGEEISFSLSEEDDEINNNEFVDVATLRRRGNQTHESFPVSEKQKEEMKNGDPQADEDEEKQQRKKQQEEIAMITARNAKINLLIIFLISNVGFVLVIQTMPSTVVQLIFLAYIILSALPKFVFGTLIPLFTKKKNNFQKNKHHFKKLIDPDETNPLKLKRWKFSTSTFDCPTCGFKKCIGHQHCKRCGTSLKEGHPVLMTACLTVHHESEVELNAGVRSFELSELPFAVNYCHLVYIIDGRYDRQGNVDNIQCQTAQFLIARLLGLSRDDLFIDNDGVPRFKKEEHKVHEPTINEDDLCAIYRGQLSKKGMPYVVLFKHTNRGKRDSHKMFFEYIHDGKLEKTAKSIMFVDSDTKFAWRGKHDSLKLLYEGLVKHSNNIGGACGEIEVDEWLSNPVTMTQYFEYKSNQFLAKTAEHYFGMVTCLPGAFCMVRPQALESIVGDYLGTAVSIWEKNQLDLGEDRTLTTLLVQSGWETKFIPEAIAKTHVPETLLGLVRQRRRWVNSTLVNMYFLLFKTKGAQQKIGLVLQVILSLELMSSITLPTAALMVIYQVFVEMGVSPPLVLSVMMLWSSAVVVGSLLYRDIDGLYWWYHGSALIGGCVIVIMCVGVMYNLGGFFDRHWLEMSVLMAWVLIVVLSALLHGQWFSIFSIVAPLAWLCMTPLMYIVIPTYSMCNFDDVTWGTRG